MGQMPWLGSVKVPLASHTHLLVDGGVAGGGGKPHLLVEVVAHRVRHVDRRVCVGAQDGPAESDGQVTGSWSDYSRRCIMRTEYSNGGEAIFPSGHLRYCRLISPKSIFPVDRYRKTKADWTTFDLKHNSIQIFLL